MCLTFDLTEPNTFKGLGKWLSEIEQYAEDYVQIVMVGNKKDKTGEIKITKDQIDEILNRYPEIQYFDASAKTNEGVSEAFEALVAAIVSSWQENTWDKWIANIKDQLIGTVK